MPVIGHMLGGDTWGAIHIFSAWRMIVTRLWSTSSLQEKRFSFRFFATLLSKQSVLITCHFPVKLFVTPFKISPPPCRHRHWCQSGTTAVSHPWFAKAETSRSQIIVYSKPVAIYLSLLFTIYQVRAYCASCATLRRRATCPGILFKSPVLRLPSDPRRRVREFFEFGGIHYPRIVVRIIVGSFFDSSLLFYSTVLFLA